jgi:rhodanese-related sulfurtransferase
MLPDPASTYEVSCAHVASWADLPQAERPRLIDCRELDEWDICHLEGAELFPLSAFPTEAAAFGESPRGIVVYCHHGMRSLRATAFLRSLGMENVFSMAGGIEEWSSLIDPNMPRY